MFDGTKPSAFPSTDNNRGLMGGWKQNVKSLIDSIIPLYSSL